jgi:hypothetical protein
MNNRQLERFIPSIMDRLVKEQCDLYRLSDSIKDNMKSLENTDIDNAVKYLQCSIDTRINDIDNLIKHQ